MVKGDGDVVWGKVVADCLAGKPERIYDGGRIEGDQFLAARWDLMQPDKYMWASVQTIRGCPKHCSFCRVWRTDGQKPRQRKFQSVIDEIVDLRRLGFRFIALADDNFYPVTLTDLRLAREQNNPAKLEELTAIRAERFQLMEELAKLPKDMVFFTQITMEAGEDGEYLDAMRRANIKGALVGVEAVTPEGLKAVFKDWNYSGEALAKQLQTFKQHGVHVLGSFIFGLPTDRPATFDATVDMALKAGVTFAQFVMMTPFPGTVDFGRWEKEQSRASDAGGRCADYALLADSRRDSPEDVYAAPHHEFGRDSRAHTEGLGPASTTGADLEAFGVHPESERRGIAFMFLSKLYRQMYAGTGISTDSARRKKSKRWARWTARQCKRLFQAKPMPELESPKWGPGFLPEQVRESGRLYGPGELRDAGLGRTRGSESGSRRTYRYSARGRSRLQTCPALDWLAHKPSERRQSI